MSATNFDLQLKLFNENHKKLEEKKLEVAKREEVVKQAAEANGNRAKLEIKEKKLEVRIDKVDNKSSKSILYFQNQIETALGNKQKAQDEIVAKIESHRNLIERIRKEAETKIQAQEQYIERIEKQKLLSDENYQRTIKNFKSMLEHAEEAAKKDKLILEHQKELISDVGTLENDKVLMRLKVELRQMEEKEEKYQQATQKAVKESGEAVKADSAERKILAEEQNRRELEERKEFARAELKRQRDEDEARDTVRREKRDSEIKELQQGGKYSTEEATEAWFKRKTVPELRQVLMKDLIVTEDSDEEENKKEESKEESEEEEEEEEKPSTPPPAPKITPLVALKSILKKPVAAPPPTEINNTEDEIPEAPENFGDWLKMTLFERFLYANKKLSLQEARKKAAEQGIPLPPLPQEEQAKPGLIQDTKKRGLKSTRPSFTQR
jgi:hypothetical protein